MAVAVSAADGGWCGSGRRPQPATASVEARTRAAEVEATMAHGIGNGARRLGSGSGGWGGKRYEVNSKSPSSGSFYKPLNSPTVILPISL